MADIDKVVATQIAGTSHLLRFESLAMKQRKPTATSTRFRVVQLDQRLRSGERPEATSQTTKGN
jgi:hypothetical protein